jgi:hypothetical protein
MVDKDRVEGSLVAASPVGYRPEQYERAILRQTGRLLS